MIPNIRTEEIRARAGGTNISVEIREARLICLEHSRCSFIYTTIYTKEI